MSRRVTLQTYLANRRGPTLTYGGGSSQPNSVGDNLGGVLDPISRNREIWETHFYSAKKECKDELSRIKDNIRSEELFIASWLSNYETNVLLMMDSEYQKIKQEVMMSMDAGHAQNKRRIKEGFKGLGGPAAAEIETIRSKLQSIRLRIEQLEEQLQSGPSYKQGIIKVISNDFESQRDEIVSSLASAFSHYESMVYLKVDATRFNQMKEDAHSLFFIDVAQLLQANLAINNPPDGSLRFTYQQLPPASTAMGHWNNSPFQEPPKKSFC